MDCLSRQAFEEILKNQEKCVRASESISTTLNPQFSQSLLDMHQGLITIRSNIIFLSIPNLVAIRDMFKTELKTKHEIWKCLRYKIPQDADSIRQLFHGK